MPQFCENGSLVFNRDHMSLYEGLWERNEKRKREIASWLWVLNTLIAVGWHKERCALRYIATGKAKMRLKRVIRDKEWIPYKGCLKRFELLSLAKTWPSTAWSRSKLMVPLPQSALRPQNEHHRVLWMTTIYMASEPNRWSHRRKHCQMDCWASRIKKKNYHQTISWENTLVVVSVHLLFLSLCLRYLHVSGSAGHAGCLIWTSAVSTDVLRWEKRREEHRWVSVVGTRRWLSGKVSVSFSCPRVLYCQHLKTEPPHPSRSLPCSVWCAPHPSDMQEVSGKRGHREKTGPNAKCSADYTHMEIHRSTIITSILSPNLILCKVILGLSIA